jgi:hypothetical protein
MLRRTHVILALSVLANGFLVAQTPNLHSLSWIAGDWQSQSGQESVEEHWTLPVDDSMIGMSRTVRGQSTRAFEFIRIIVRENAIYYIASPNGRKVAEFKLVEGDSQRAVFEGGDEHVQRVIYRSNGPNGLIARVEGTQEGKAFAEDYTYTRIQPGHSVYFPLDNFSKPSDAFSAVSKPKTLKLTDSHGSAATRIGQ